jgi:hypothetical protein
MLMTEPTELESAVARVMYPLLGIMRNELGLEAHTPASKALALDLARAAIAEVFRHRHTDPSTPCPLCGFVVTHGRAAAVPHRG